MPTRSPEIITRASQLDEDLVPEPWDLRDSKGDRSLVAERERYRLQGATDGQGAGIVPAYNLNVADTEAIPQNTQDGWTRGSAGRVLNAQGQYVSRGSDVPRKSFDGEDPGLLVEAASRTNRVRYSSAINQTNWGIASSSLKQTAVSSIISGETAYNQKSDTDQNDRLQGDAGSFSSGQETVRWIIEEDTASRVLFTIRDDASGGNIENFDYDFSTDTASLIVNDAGIEVNSRTLTQKGPNGGQVVSVTMRYDPTNTSGGDVSGNNRDIQVFPDRSGNINATTLHHAQIEEAPNASSPIVTQGSPVTRSADDYAIFEGGQPDWWNPNEGTLIVSWENLGFTFETSFDLISSESGSFLGYIGRYSKLDYVDSSVNFLGINGSATGFETHVAALSMKPSENVIALNGSTDTGPHDGSLLNSTDMTLEHKAASYKKLLYTPRALPESTLNQITS